MLVVELVMRITLTYLVSIVATSNAIPEINWGRLYFVMKKKKMDRRRKGAGPVRRKSVSFWPILLKVVNDDWVIPKYI